MLDGIRMLLDPDLPLWVKLGVLLVAVVALWAWWTEPYWHNLNKSDKEDDAPRKARPW